MLTPNFDLSQNEEFLIISIQIPYAKISEIEVHFEDTDFMFYLKPYYLRLNLPGKVLYSEKPYINYDVDKKILTVKAEKAEKGQVFEGLDLITKLLAPKKNKVSATPMIEVIDGLDTSQDDEELDWTLEQTPCEELNNINIHGDHQCGFANSYSYAVFNLKEETREIFDVRDPQSKAPHVRREERLKTESEYFDKDHYIADLYEDEEIQQLLSYRPEWDTLYDKFQADSTVKSPDDLIHFTSEEKDRLRKLPSKEYILEKHQVKMAFLSLIDIIFAYAYNKRTTMGDNTVESGWTVNKLSATLSWLETFFSVSDVAVTSIRRSLCYPLFRHFELSVTILDDVRKIFLLGRKYVIKCLLEIHEIFSLSEPRYILNDLFITDYCVWMQTKRCSSDKLVPIANTLGKVLLTKGDVGFNLVDVESFAAIAWMRHNQSDKELPNPSNKDKCTTVAEKGAKSQTPEDDLCTNMEQLSFQRKQSDDTEGCSNNVENSNSVCNDLFSEYETCSSCTSGSSCSSSYTYESDSDSCSDEESSSSSSDSEEDSDSSSSDSDDGAHRHLLKKETGEKHR